MTCTIVQALLSFGARYATDQVRAAPAANLQPRLRGRMLRLHRDTSGHETAAESVSFPTALLQDQWVDSKIASLRRLS